MKISPEPHWDAPTRIIHVFDTDLRSGLRSILLAYTTGNCGGKITYFKDKTGVPLGSWTPEFFLDLPRRHQLRFLSVAKRMHDTGVDR